MWRQTDLLLFDEIHNTADWKACLKGVIDARLVGQALVV